MDFEKMMKQKIETINIKSLLDDLRPFIVDSAQIADWSKEMLLYFLAKTETIES
jgi:hypothetical protein